MAEEDISSELDAFLKALERDEAYRVDAVLKDSPAERTERVYLRCGEGESGPYIRKTIDRDSSAAAVYRDLHGLYVEGKTPKHVPCVRECHEAGEKLVVVTDFVRGETLRSVVALTPVDGRLSLAREIMPSLCDAVGELHGCLEKPIVHRDLTPGNVMCELENPSALAVIDFGIARFYNPGSTTDTSHFGTRPYAPPEQFGFGQTDVRTDVYALGMLLFFILTGRDATQVDRSEGYRDPNVPEGMRQVVLGAVALDPSSRFETAGKLKEAFLLASECLMPPTGEDGRFVPLRSSRALHRAGAVWNFLLCALYVVGLALLAVCAIDPNGANPTWPAWFRVFTYLGFVHVCLAVLLWSVAYKEDLRFKYPALRGGLAGSVTARLFLVVGAAVVDLLLFVSLGAGSVQEP